MVVTVNEKFFHCLCYDFLIVYGFIAYHLAVGLSIYSIVHINESNILK
jgi:hypothetical protein